VRVDPGTVVRVVTLIITTRKVAFKVLQYAVHMLVGGIVMMITVVPSLPPYNTRMRNSLGIYPNLLPAEFPISDCDSSMSFAILISKNQGPHRLPSPDDSSDFDRVACTGNFVCMRIIGVNPRNSLLCAALN
jgi:hypothetical protein